MFIGVEVTVGTAPGVLGAAGVPGVVGVLGRGCPKAGKMLRFKSRQIAAMQSILFRNSIKSGSSKVSKTLR